MKKLSYIFVLLVVAALSCCFGVSYADMSLTNLDVENYLYPHSTSLSAENRIFTVDGKEMKFIYTVGNNAAVKCVWTDIADSDHTKTGADLINAFSDETNTALEFWIYYSGENDTSASFVLSNRSDQYWADPTTQVTLPNSKLLGNVEGGNLYRAIVRTTDLTGSKRANVLSVVHLMSIQFNKGNAKLLVSQVNVIQTTETTGLYDGRAFEPDFTEPEFSIDNVTDGNQKNGDAYVQYNLLPESVSVSEYSLKLTLTKGTESIVLTDKSEISAYEFKSAGIWTLNYKVYDEHLNCSEKTKTVTIAGAPDYEIPETKVVYENENTDIFPEDIVVSDGKTATVYVSWEGRDEFVLTKSNSGVSFAAGKYNLSYRVSDGTLDTVKTTKMTVLKKESVDFGTFSASTVFGTDSTHSTPHYGNSAILPGGGYASIFYDARTTGLANNFMGFGYEPGTLELTGFEREYLAVSFWYYTENAGDMVYGNFKLVNEKGSMTNYYVWNYSDLGIVSGKWNRIVLSLSDAQVTGSPFAMSFEGLYAWGYRASSGQSVTAFGGVQFMNYIGESKVAETVDPSKTIKLGKPDFSLPDVTSAEYTESFDLTVSGVSLVDSSYGYKGILTITRPDESVYSVVEFTADNMADLLGNYLFSTGNDYTLKYTITDDIGNTETKTTTLTVTGKPVDATPPQITVGEYDDEIDCSTKVDFSGIVTVTDDVDGIITDKLTIGIYKNGTLVATIGKAENWSYTFLTSGEYTVKFNAKDSSDNAAEEKSITVTVLKRTEEKPTVSIGKINGKEIKDSYFFDNTIVLSDISAYDAFGNELEYEISVTSPKGAVKLSQSMSFNIDEYGTYTIKITATDADGNVGEQTYTFTVEEEKTGGSGCGGSNSLPLFLALVFCGALTVKIKK
ncbi:MAG: hypothetical protein ACI4S9_08545 [Christensenellales bacterium]